MQEKSHPARGAWIEIGAWYSPETALPSRTPQGVRGLKFVGYLPDDGAPVSHPARGAWIEIPRLSRALRCLRSHPARGAWIEILLFRVESRSREGRTPQGVRGLKVRVDFRDSDIGCRTPQGVRGLKYGGCWKQIRARSSHPARGAWIEIF